MAGAYPQKAGLKGLPPSVVQLTFPDINFSGTNSPGGWQGTNAHFFTEVVNTFTSQNNIMYVKGRHSMVFGFQYQALQDNENFALFGSFNFNSAQTQGYNAAGSLLTTTGSAYASYLLGAVGSSGVSQNSVGETGGRFKTYAAYIQGGPSHIDTFDQKPLLDRDHMKPPPFKLETTFNPVGALMKSPWAFRRYGQSGMLVSDLFPNVAQHVDKICFLHSWSPMGWTTAARSCRCTPAR